ncbi:MAG: hypothetical protein M3Y39_01020 [Chloroflexota bacterium]|nr:hypothetical protein [Chloroflexota bacterium]
MTYHPSSITRFASQILGKPLYPYQSEIAEAILASILNGQGRIFTVMLARQSGKNQLSAVLEAFLLTYMRQGTIVKAAPTFNPQITNSSLRLLSLLDTPYTRGRIWQSQGHIIGLAPSSDPAQLRAHAGPRILFFSAGPESNVVGATADLLLEIDEAQDVECEKFDRDFRPMASTTNATTVLYGTAWSDSTLLAQQSAVNQELAQRTGERQHFAYDWRALAAINPAYRSFVENEIARLGEDHLAIQTQYFLRPISGAGYFLNSLQRTLLQGTHAWQEEAQESGCYIAAMDVAGEDLPSPTLQKSKVPRSTRRDSTVLTIGQVRYNELNLPVIEVVHHEWWTGLPHQQQYAMTLALMERWRVRSLVIDATGLGAGLASLLRTALGDERVVPLTFTRSSKSHLAYQLLSLLNSGRLKLYAPARAPQGIFDECWLQLRNARYSLPAPDTLNFYVNAADGHDDFLCSLALLPEALSCVTNPAASTIVRPIRLYGGEGRF